MKPVIRIGIIGFGSMGHTHAWCIQNIPYFYTDIPFTPTIAGICTNHFEKTNALCNQLSLGIPFHSVDEMIKDQTIDVIDICSPNNSHATFLLKAIEHQKNILCEKPFCFSLNEAEKVYNKSLSSNKTHGMVFNNRFIPAVIKAKQIIETQLLGKILSFDFIYDHNTCIDPNRTIGWKQDKNICGGGTLFDLGPHIIDLSQYLIGKISSICGMSQIAFQQHKDLAGITQETNADEAFYMMAIMDNGAKGTLRVSKIHNGANDDLSFSIYGTKGSLKFSLMEPNWLYFYDVTKMSNLMGGLSGYTKIECVGHYPPPGGSFPSPKAPIGWLRGHLHSYYSYLSAVNNNEAYTPSFKEGLYVQKILEAVQQSADKNQWVTIC